MDDDSQTYLSPYFLRRPLVGSVVDIELAAYVENARNKLRDLPIPVPFDGGKTMYGNSYIVMVVTYV